MSSVIGELVERGLVRATDDGRNAPYVYDRILATVAAVLRKREWMLLERSRQALEGLVVEADRLGDAAHLAGYDFKRARVLLGVTEAAQNLLRMVIGFPTASNSERIGGWLKNVTGLIRRLRQA